MTMWWSERAEKIVKKSMLAFFIVQYIKIFWLLICQNLHENERNNFIEAQARKKEEVSPYIDACFPGKCSSLGK